jgi:hypothetical protein
MFHVFIEIYIYIYQMPYIFKYLQILKKSLTTLKLKIHKIYF